MEKIFQVDGTTHEDIDKALRKAGFRPVSIGQPIPANEISGILGTIKSSVRNALEAGRSVLIPTERSEFSNGNDRVVVDSFNIQEAQIIRPDPVIFVYEEIPGRTSRIVEEILEEEVTKDVIKFALTSITGKKFRRSVCDLARLKNEQEEVVYNRCVKALIKSCVSGFRRIEVAEDELVAELPQLLAGAR
ncbi:MAG: hypothetical protein HY295_05085 [Thaumarchaeota archaeon]|nr:hypothetical protein [Nitrososphaerota archaeon]